MVKKIKSKKKTNNISLYLSVLVLLAGISLFLYPLVADYFANQDRTVAVSHYDNRLNKLSKKKLAEELLAAEAYNKYIFSAQQGLASGPEPDYKSIINLAKVMGTVDIPAIDIKNMPFFHGSDPKTLYSGLGHLKGTSIPIGGKNTRAVITGHSGVQNQVLFSNINLLKKKDIFYINILNKKMAYQVESLKRVYPDEIDSIKIVAGRDLVTLLTCDPPGINTYRLLVTGKRVPLKFGEKLPVTKRNWFDYQHMVLYGAIVLLIMMLIWYILKRRKRRKKLNE